MASNSSTRIAATSAAGTCADGVADKDRLFVYGISYGGYMTTWLVGQTDRFRAAVAQNAVTDLSMMWHLSDLQSWTERESRSEWIARPTTVSSGSAASAERPVSTFANPQSMTCTSPNPRLPLENLDRFQAGLEQWRHSVYNAIRPHEALGDLATATRWRPCERQRP